MLGEFSLIYYAGIGFAGLAIYILVINFFTIEEKFKASEQLEDGKGKENKNKNDFILRVSKPLFKRYVSPVVSSLKWKKNIREKYRRKLANAGLTEELTPDDFFAFKIFLIIAFPMVYLLANEFGQLDWPLKMVPIVSVFGYFYPDIWLSAKIQERMNQIVLSMPFAVDMLALSVEAGLDFIAAMGKVIEKAPPSALTEEFQIVIKEIRIGASRAEALRALAWRTNVIEMASFCATLIAADSVGASIAPILKALASDMRTRRSANIEKVAAKAESKILLPLMMFIVPSVFIIIMAPILLEAFGLT